MKKPLVRIKDIAAMAQVSTGTVDRVIHNRGRVANEVRDKVLKIIGELNYEPNIMARTLGANRSFNLAVLVPDAQLDDYWEGPNSGIARAEKELKQYGVQITRYIFNQFKITSFLDKANEITKLNPDGILFAPVFHREALPYFSQWENLKIPYVLFNTQITEFSPLSYIGQDSWQSGMLAAKLLHYGQLKTAKTTFIIAHIEEDISNSAHLLTKENGFREYFKLNTDETIYSIISTELKNSTFTFEEQIDALLYADENIKGFFVTNSKAHLIAAYLEKKELKDIQLIGYDLLQKNINYVEKGFIDFIINQNPEGQGYYGILSLTDALIFKKTVVPFKYLPLDIITKENVQYYLSPQ